MPRPLIDDDVIESLLPKSVRRRKRHLGRKPITTIPLQRTRQRPRQDLAIPPAAHPNERRQEVHAAFLVPGCSIICWRFSQAE